VTDARDLYAAERARQLARQSRRVPADPQQVPAAGDPRARVAVLMHPCGTETGPWRPCGHPQLSHQGCCTIATAAGPCGCRRYRPSAAHDFGPDGTALTCLGCGRHLLDLTGPCPGAP
jgi:hypothetical protein